MLLVLEGILSQRTQKTAQMALVMSWMKMKMKMKVKVKMKMKMKVNLRQLALLASSHSNTSGFDLGSQAQATSNPGSASAGPSTVQDTIPSVSPKFSGARKKWSFPKMHSHKHGFDDVEEKGATRNFNAKVNEQMHGPLVRSYELRTNKKNVADQVPC